jgi:hypothetical protein
MARLRVVGSTFGHRTVLSFAPPVPGGFGEESGKQRREPWFAVEFY